MEGQFLELSFFLVCICAHITFVIWLAGTLRDYFVMSLLSDQVLVPMENKAQQSCALMFRRLSSHDKLLCFVSYIVPKPRACLFQSINLLVFT